MKNRIVLFAAAFMLSTATGFSAAPLLVENSMFSLTYPDGWATNPFLPSRDSMSIVMDTATEAMSWAMASNQAGGMTSEQYIQAMTQAYTNQFQRTDSSVKTLGGKAFRTTGWKDTTADGDSSARVRIYAYTQGDFIFISWLIYNSPDGDAAVADVEAALATLKLKGVSIRRAVWSRRMDIANTRLDVLGRTWAPASGRTAKTPFFLRR